MATAVVDQAPAGAKLFTRQSSGLVREVSVVNALFFNTCAFIGGGAGWYPLSYTLSFVPIGTMATLTTYGWGTIIFGIFATILGLIFASLASVMPRSGGDYVFTSRIVPRVGPFIGWLESFTLAFACIAIILFEIALVLIGLQVTGRIVGLGTGIQLFQDANGWFAEDGIIKGIPGLIAGLVVVAGIVWVVIQPTRRFHRIVTGLAIIALVAVIAQFVFGLLFTDRASFEANLALFSGGTTAAQLQQAAVDNGVFDPANPGINFDPTVFSFVLAIILLNFIGFQYSAYISGEVRGNVRRGILIGVLGALAIGVFMNSIYVDWYTTRLGLETQLGWGVLYWGGTGPDLPLGQPNVMPLTSAVANPGLWPVWALISLGGTLFPFLLCPVYIIFMSRIALAWSLDRQVPEWFGEVNERIHAPLNAILAIVGVVVVFLLLQNFPLLPAEVAPPDGRLTLIAFLWLSILLALLSWVMPGVNAILARWTRPDLVANAPWSRWLPILGIGWLAFAVTIYWVAGLQPLIDAIGATLQPGAEEATLAYLTRTGVSLTILLVILAIVFYVVRQMRNRSAGIDTRLMYQQIPPD
jgi:amino acid transporter